MRETQEAARRWFSVSAPPGPEPVLLQHLRSYGFRWLQAADALVLLGVMIAINLVRFGSQWPTYPMTHYAVGFAVACTIHLVVYYFGGLYEPENRLGHRPWLPRVVWATLIAVLLDSLAALTTGRYLMPRINLVFLMLAASVLLTANRHLSRVIRLSRAGPPRVFLVGIPDDVNLARAHLHESDRAAVIVGEVTDMTHLLDHVYEAGATDVLLLSSDTLSELYPEPLTEFERRGIGMLQRIGAQETLLGLREVREVAGMPFVPLRAHTLLPSRARLKRWIEVLVLVLVSPVAVPVYLLAALYVRIVAGRPILFRQDRVGANGQTFKMIKFRTMYPNAEEGIGPVLARKSDPRVIPACQWLRDTRLDELPQLWNVLRGEMSIVGPRPERPELTERHVELIPGYARRHEIPPGITGLAQIHGRYHTDPTFKLGHDLQYLVNWSPILDLEIALRTLWVVFTRRV
ncbi:MAG: exopolysaccharide biosynthesis polyprenyl glycosylphosphotransferase [Acidimicrobiia bacterium]|nr:exopolysaccharide biosynthesis polyprenyl glycosylphosphotransferase [Acidimicrobiia bacterium]